MVRKNRGGKRTTGGKHSAKEVAKSSQEVPPSNNPLNDTESRVKRFKVTSDGSEHVFQKLFEEGKYSDITICTLGNRWELHKEIIIKSPFFANLISSDNESKEFDISLADPNLTKEAFSSVISTLYTNEINIDSSQLVPILATAKLLNLNRLVDKCTEIILNNIDAKTAVSYHNVATTYGTQALEESTMQWLTVNLLTSRSDDLNLLAQISPELMQSIVSSTELIIEDSEMNVYDMLKNWLYARMRNNDNNDERAENCDDFFKSKNWETPFLTTDEGTIYRLPFQDLRIQHLLLDCSSSIYDTIRADKILPEEWISAALAANWKILGLATKNQTNRSLQLNEPVFEKECVRLCFEFYQKDDKKFFICPDFLFGLNLSFSLDSEMSTVSVNRDTAQDSLSDDKCIVSSKANYQLAIKVSLKWINARGFQTREQTSEIQHLALEADKEEIIMTTVDKITYPVYLAVKILINSPLL